jgi:NifU-like protein involved in Fe-S cluster formation
MSTDADLMSLYSTRILALAASIPHVGRLDHPQASVRKRAPLCGSTVTVDLSLVGDVITEFAQDVKACALGQAAASVLGSVVLGRTLAEVRTARDALRAMLKSEGPVPDAPIDGFEVLLPARGFGNRHASILLAIEATVEAGEEAQRAACA